MTHSKGRFDGKVAMVTGAASGIGRAIAERLHAEGASVLGSDVNVEGLDTLGEALGDRFLARAGDVTVEADVALMVDAAVDHFGGLHHAFNVAGGNRAGYLLDLEAEDWDFTVDLCLKSVFLCIKHQARRMGTGKAGSIVNIASLNCVMQGNSSTLIGQCSYQSRMTEFRAHESFGNTVNDFPL